MKEVINKVLKYIKNDIRCNYKAYIIFLLIVPWFFIRFNYYIYSPGSLIDLDGRIKVSDEYKSSGSFNLTYVSAKNGTLPIILLSYIIPNWDLVSIDKSRIEDENADEIVLRNKIYLKETSYDAVISAFKEAGISYNIDSYDLTVSFVNNDSDTDMIVGDIIKKINGEEVKDFNDLKDKISKYNSGETIKISVIRDGKNKECYSKLYKENDRVIMGVMIAEVKNVSTNPTVEYVFKDNESGASRGLMCALYIYDKITSYDLTKGYKISGTGTIDENGKIGIIDGVKYKLLGASKKKADIFIVPKGNYDEAIKVRNKYNLNIKIITGETLHDVISELLNM